MRKTSEPWFHRGTSGWNLHFSRQLDPSPAQEEEIREIIQHYQCQGGFAWLKALRFAASGQQSFPEGRDAGEGKLASVWKTSQQEAPIYAILPLAAALAG